MTNKKNQDKKLILKRQTLRVLEPSQLTQVVGGLKQPLTTTSR